MDLAEMRQTVRDVTGLRMPELHPDASIDAAINDTYFEVLRLDKWPFIVDRTTLPTVAGQAEYQLPAAVRNVMSVSVPADGRVLEQRSVLVFEQERDTTEGKPIEFVLAEDGTLELWPTPNEVETLQLRHTKTLPGLSADADEPVFREEYHLGLVYGAAAVLLKREADDTDRAGVFSSLYQGTVEQMRSDYMRQHAKRRLVFGSRRSGERASGLRLRGL